MAGQDYQIGGEYQIQAPGESDYSYDYQNAIANAWHRDCPKNKPALGSPCSVPGWKSCSYGSECCCGKCHPSFVAQCEWISANGRRSWVGFNTDACLRPNCGNTDCPKNKPALGSPCSVPGSERCSYGSECCCGKCHPSFVATCQLISGRHSWVGFNTDACLRPNCGNADCPKNAPALGSPCSVPASKSCSYGSECCCGKCHPSFIARCYLARAPNGRRTWRGSYTDACLRPNCGSTDACSQPSGITGPCKAAVPRWTFDKERGCQRFTYGGCAGNANNFYTRAECLKTCIRIDTSEGAHSQPLY